jgi:trans-aconitate 2-methyltransferase
MTVMPSNTMTWEPSQYLSFKNQRLRPALELLGRIPLPSPRRVVDLGCGAGNVTRFLRERWPQADLVGVDSSAEMLDEARALEGKVHRLRFVQGELASFTPAERPDLIVSNAALHWVDDHEPLLDRLAARLAPGGTLAVQLPANFDAASHVLLRETAADGPWAERVDGALRDHAVHPLPVYVDRLLAAGLRVDAWETVYLHLLLGDDPVLNWVSGTALRPVLALLDEGEARRFTAEYGARLRAAYPRGAHGTLFPFRRIFFVATREESPSP